MTYQLMDTPIGRLRLISNGTQLLAIEFENQYSLNEQAGISDVTDELLCKATRQLSEYFDRRRTTFDLPLGAKGTHFQHTVWGALTDIPYGELRSYRDIARSIGNAKAVRAVGAANGRNPLPIVVPCHRVVGSNGSLTGFAGGLEAKEILLRLEGAMPSESSSQAEDSSRAKRSSNI